MKKFDITRIGPSACAYGAHVALTPHAGFCADPTVVERLPSPSHHADRVVEKDTVSTKSSLDFQNVAP